MDAISLNPLSDFIKEAGDAEWTAFLPDVEPELATAEEREQGLQEFHKIAKDAFRRELRSYADSEGMAKWAGEDISEDELDEQIFLVASSLTGEEISKLAQVESFIELEEQQLDEDYEETLQALHGIAKEAFLAELRHALDDNEDLVKQALAIADELDFDTSIAKLAADSGCALTKEARFGAALKGAFSRFGAGAGKGWRGVKIDKATQLGHTRQVPQTHGLSVPASLSRVNVPGGLPATLGAATGGIARSTGRGIGQAWRGTGKALRSLGNPVEAVKSLASQAAGAVTRAPRGWIASKQGQLRGAFSSRPISPLKRTGGSAAIGRQNLAKGEASFTRDIRAAKQVGDTARMEQLIAGRRQWRALPQGERSVALVENPARYGFRATPAEQVGTAGVTARPTYGQQAAGTPMPAERAAREVARDVAQVERRAVTETMAANPALTEAQAREAVRAAEQTAAQRAGGAGGAGGAGTNLAAWFGQQSTPVKVGLGAAGVLGGRKLLVD